MDVLLAILKIGLLLGAAAMVGFSVISLLGTRKFMGRAVSAEGTILEIIRATPISGKTGGTATVRYYFHVAFMSRSGQEIRFRSARVKREDYRPGDTVDVLYDPAGVGEPRLSSFQGIWGRTIDIAFYSLNFVAAWFMLSILGGFLPFMR